MPSAQEKPIIRVAPNNPVFDRGSDHAALVG